MFNKNEFNFGKKPQNNFIIGENYNFKVFKIFINLYNLSKIIETKLNNCIQIKEEYFLIHLQWLQKFKTIFNYKELEKFFEEKCNSATLNENLDKTNYIINKFNESKFDKKKTIIEKIY